MPPPPLALPAQRPRACIRYVAILIIRRLLLPPLRLLRLLSTLPVVVGPSAVGRSPWPAA